MPEYQAPTGTRDILPPESHRWERLIAVFADHAQRSGFGMIHTPLFEDLGVFTRIGASTDVVTKEMYDFEDKGGRRIALKPEGTASVARAFVQHRPTTPWKVWYFSPAFRYERPQAGRFRQHHQVSVEAIGTADPDLDVETIALACRFYQSLGLTKFTLKLNSLGDDKCRPLYREALLSYLRSHEAQLNTTVKERMELNPLRALDSKDPDMADIIANAPTMLDYLCDECKENFARVQQGLHALDVPFVIDERLVRGLDYYTRSTFEFASEALDSAQNAIGGGGRYDGLVEQLGGPSTPAIGFSLGVERILLACDAEGVFVDDSALVDVFVVDVTGGEEAVLISQQLRDAGVRVDRGYDQRSMKSQFKAADRSGAAYAVIIGDDEQANGQVTLRPLRADGEQETVTRADLVDEVRKRL